MEYLDNKILEKSAFILKAIAHPIRLAIIFLLSNNEKLAVTEICKKINCEQSLASHHLNNMKLKGILESKKKGLNIFYSLKEKEIMNMLKCIEKCNCN